MVKQSQRGFGLLEALITLVVIGTAVISVAMYMGRQSKAETRAAYVLSEAKDLALLSEAVQRWAIAKADVVAAWYDGQPHGVTLTDLIDAGALPDGFAHRFGEIGVSPFNQPYAAVAWGRLVDDSPGPLLWVLYETGAVNLGVFSAAGGSVDAEGLLALKRAIASAAMDEYGIDAGVVPPGSTVLVAANRSWAQDVAEDFTSGFATTAEARAAVLVGYPELDPTGASDPTETPSEPVKWKDVFLVNATIGRLNPLTDSCAEVLPGSEPIVSFPECNEPPGAFLIYPSDLGPITVRYRFKRWTEMLKDWWDRLPGVYSDDDLGQVSTNAYDFYFKYLDIFLNGALIGTNTCASEGWRESHMYAPNQHTDYPDPAGNARCDKHSSRPYQTDPHTWCVMPTASSIDPPRHMNHLCGTRIP